MTGFRWSLMTLAVIAAPVVFADAELSGRSLAAACAGCHGSNGVPAVHSSMGALAGMKKEVMLEKFAALQSGALPSTVMKQILKGYSAEQLDAIAAWFAAQNAPKAP